MAKNRKLKINIVVDMVQVFVIKAERFNNRDRIEVPYQN